MSDAEPCDEDPRTGAYRHLQLIVGIIAIALPIAVWLGDRVIADQPLRGSISAYYYGRTGSYFVGSLCALGVFFLSYEYRPRQGYELDRRASIAAAAFAVVVALFPTKSTASNPSAAAEWVSRIHLGAAMLLFVLLAVFSLAFFTKSGTAPITAEKQRRNAIYRTCGWTIVGAIVVAVVSMFSDWPRLFWPEAVAVIAFGISWLVKSDAIPALRDRKSERAP